MWVDDDGEELYDMEEHEALCRYAWIRFRYSGPRKACDRPAVRYIGVDFPSRMGFCEFHWRNVEDAILSEIYGSADTDHWIVRAALERATSHVVEERMAKAEAKRRQRNAEMVARLGAEAWGNGKVYFVQAGERGPIKIGKSNDFARRLPILQTGCPYPLQLRALIPGGAALERAYHDLYAEHRLVGEWFNPVGEIRREIKRLRRGSTTLW